MREKISVCMKLVRAFAVGAAICAVGILAADISRRGPAAWAGDSLERRIAEFREGKDTSAPERKSAPSAEAAHGKSAPAAPEVHPKTTVRPKESAAHGGSAPAPGHGAAGIVPGEALKMLMDGNARFASGRSRGPNRSAARRAALSGGQRPFAVIVGCSDSRVPPELLFDRGLGDLFVVRTAGNVVDNIAIGSIEYAVEHLGANLIVVLGHKKCGAVAAAVQGGEAPGHLRAIVDAIAPAVERAKRRRGELPANSVRANVRIVVDRLAASGPLFPARVDEGSLKIVGAHYDIDTGIVTVTYDPCGVNDAIL